MSDKDDLFEGFYRAQRLITAIDTALRGKPKNPFLRTRAYIDIAETHKDFEVRKTALAIYLSRIERNGFIPWPEDIKRLHKIVETAPTPGIRFEAEVVLGNLDSPDRAMLRHRLDTILGMPKGFSQDPSDFKHTPDDITRYREECVKIACAEGDVKMRVAAIDAWASLAGDPHLLPSPPEQTFGTPHRT